MAPITSNKRLPETESGLVPAQPCPPLSDKHLPHTPAAETRSPGGQVQSHPGHHSGSLLCVLWTANAGLCRVCLGCWLWGRCCRNPFQIKWLEGGHTSPVVPRFFGEEKALFCQTSCLKCYFSSPLFSWVCKNKNKFVWPLQPRWV